MDGLIAVTGMRAGFNPSEEATVRDMFFHFCTLRAPYPGPRWQNMEMNRAIEAHNIKPAIDEHVFNFEEAREAVEYFEGMNHFGKVYIQVAKDI
ncbi:hypothetical protein FAUST_8928 [Fusarium austroamericanum]|uniref:Alcohol dehydrogenase n=1 Tax=Fusarium austroamericanum TaxID=282268 RepID=A0AAN5Z3N9_FUSAU|nr:hypothetical protein FAUST_8928 [Fusarium austroamericanum]